MRTRLQMTPREAQAARSTMIRDMSDLALFVGASSCSVEAVDMAVREKYGDAVRVKAAYVTRAERWEVRFLRAPGGWLTTGRRLQPEPGALVPGERLPRYVRLAIPIATDGKVPASLAPRRADLPRLVPGAWRHASPKGRGVPTVTVQVAAPRWGVHLYVPGTSVPFLPVRFPANKSRFQPALRRLVAAGNAQFRGRVIENNERRAQKRAEAEALLTEEAQ